MWRRAKQQHRLMSSGHVCMARVLFASPHEKEVCDHTFLVRQLPVGRWSARFTIRRAVPHTQAHRVLLDLRLAVH